MHTRTSFSLNWLWLRVTVTLRLAVYRQSVRLGDKPLETHGTVILFSNWTLAVIVLMWHWGEDGSVVYNCCWSSPAQSFSGQSHAGLMTTFYSLRFETPPTWRARSPYLYPPGTGCPNYTPRHWVPFSSPPTARRATVEVFDPASTRELTLAWTGFLLYIVGSDRQRKRLSIKYPRKRLSISDGWFPRIASPRKRVCRAVA
jgi:hypothetical protein